MSEVRAKEFQTAEEGGPNLTEQQPGGETAMHRDGDGMTDKEAVRIQKELQELSEELNKMLDLKVRKNVSNNNVII